MGVHVLQHHDVICATSQTQSGDRRSHCSLSQGHALIRVLAQRNVLSQDDPSVAPNVHHVPNHARHGFRTPTYYEASGLHGRVPHHEQAHLSLESNAHRIRVHNAHNFHGDRLLPS